MPGPTRRTAANWLSAVVGLLLVALAVAIVVEVARNPTRAIPKVIIGTKDQVYYSHAATMQEATALGHALEATGFFSDRGTSVMLTKNKGVTTVSFVVNDGAWDNPDTAASFEEIGRRVAPEIGGFPITVRLVDGRWAIHKTLAVGRTMSGTKDVVYYFGAATEADAKALAQALRAAGYLEDLGVSVAISKDGGTDISFVVGQSVWDRADAVAGFMNLARRVAPAVGGLPVELRLLDAQMETKKQVEVR